MEGFIRTSKDNFISKNKLSSGNAVDNLTMKQFNTGTLWVDSIGEDGDRIRGMTVDAIFFDEVQDMFSQAIGNATKTLTAAKYGPIGQGVQVYFGTPKEKIATFHHYGMFLIKGIIILDVKTVVILFHFIYQKTRGGWISGFLDIP